MRNEAGKLLSDELLAQLQTCVEDGWPLRQIAETFGTSHRTMKKHFPEYRGETDYALCGEIAEMLRKLGWTDEFEKMKHNTWNDDGFATQTAWRGGQTFHFRER